MEKSISTQRKQHYKIGKETVSSPFLQLEGCMGVTTLWTGVTTFSLLKRIFTFQRCYFLV